MSGQRTTQRGSFLARESDCRQLPVRLCDIKPVVRLRAAQRVAEREPHHAGLLLWAALNPSTETYFVHESALPLYLKVAA